MPQALAKLSRFSKMNEEDAEGSVARGTLVYFVNGPWEIIRLKRSVKTTGQQLNKTAPPRGTRKDALQRPMTLSFQEKTIFPFFFYYIVIIIVPLVACFPMGYESG
ncbi:unnamed protein product [Macrosiphum euphorbiae]|uniref:Uncharacterized protein n=1 Tax=Macrosiphum euphorbiae TaxID=13131 RepID=A0AAV0XDW8_9HEMI|nr:unnamed protein product [Macrosiphum euphorbiae]